MDLVLSPENGNSSLSKGIPNIITSFPSATIWPERVQGSLWHDHAVNHFLFDHLQSGREYLFLSLFLIVINLHSVSERYKEQVCYCSSLVSLNLQVHSNQLLQEVSTQCRVFQVVRILFSTKHSIDFASLLLFYLSSPIVLVITIWIKQGELLGVQVSVF